MATKDLYKDEKSKDETKKTSDKKSMNAYRVLVKPLATEKGAHFATENKYLFEVACDTNKVEIKKATELALNVKVAKVSVMNVSGKARRIGRMVGKKPDWKKAIVTLKPGEKLEIFEGV